MSTSVESSSTICRPISSRGVTRRAAPFSYIFCTIILRRWKRVVQKTGFRLNLARSWLLGIPLGSLDGSIIFFKCKSSVKCHRTLWKCQIWVLRGWHLSVMPFDHRNPLFLSYHVNSKTNFCRVLFHVWIQLNWIFKFLKAISFLYRRCYLKRIIYLIDRILLPGSLTKVQISMSKCLAYNGCHKVNVCCRYSLK